MLSTCMFLLGIYHLWAQSETFTFALNDYGLDKAKVYPPHQFAPSQNPVLYLFGNDEEANYTIALTRQLALQKKMPHLWVVQLPEIELSNDRLDPNMVEFIEEQLVVLQAQFKTANYRITTGHDYGALMGLQLLMARPVLFNAALLAAPPIYRLNEPERQYRTFLVEYMDFDGFVYIANGFGDHAAMHESQILTRLMKAHSVERPMTYEFEIMESELNATVFPKMLEKGLTKLFADTQMTTMMPYGGMEGWWDKKEALIKKYGFDPLGLAVKAIPFSQRLLTLDPQNTRELDAFMTYLKRDRTGRYNFDPIHYYSLANYWWSIGKSELAKSLERMSKSKSKSANRYNNQPPEVAKGKVIHLRMDGSDNGLKINEGVTLTEGRLGMAMKFDGKSGMGEVILPSQNQFQNSFSISVWLKPQEIGRFNRFLARPRADDIECAWQVGFGPLADLQWGISTYNDAYQDYWVNDNILLNEWIHLTVVVDQTLGEVRYYKNGEYYKSVPRILLFTPSTENLLLGCNALKKGHYQGVMDELYLYDRALSKQEIKLLFQKK